MEAGRLLTLTMQPVRPNRLAHVLPELGIIGAALSGAWHILPR